MWQSVFVWLSIGGGILAAVLWYVASSVKIESKTEGGWSEGGLMWSENGKEYNIGRTFIAANLWNAWAAGTTAGAVFLQALAQVAQQMGS